MNKVKQLLAVAAIVVAPFMSAGIAAADTCDVGYTGPNSDNLCSQTTTYECTVNDNNTVTVDNGNTQIAVTGDAENGLSGSATNSNGTVFAIEISNEKVCMLTTSVPATPTPPAKETKVTPKVTAQPAVLAPTDGDSTSQILLMTGIAALVTTLATLAVTRALKR